MRGAASEESSSRTVLVTGSAGGIGSAVVRALCRDGYRVVGLDLEASPANLDIEWITHDLLDTEGTAKLLADSPLLGGLRHVVAVAGGPLENEIGRLDPAEVPLEVFRASVELNLVAQYVLVRGAAARIEAETTTADRSIVLISSINALRGYGMPGYSAAKAGLLGLVVSLALPLGRRRLRINAVVPGTVVTERFRDEYPPDEGLSPRLIDATASGSATRPEDVADAVSAVLELRQMTGQQLVIDGGQMAVPLDRYPLA